MDAGQKISDNIQLVRLLGEGGMGSVWVADHLTLHTQVAVKFMSSALAKDHAAATRFTREATAAAQIKSPHVVQIFDHGITPEGIPYIVMELMEGQDLGKRIETLGALGVEETAKVIAQTCKALAKAHNNGIVHRDIKPDNIFLVSTEDDIFVKVLDFGIAKQTGGDTGFGMTSTGMMVGTPYYMSPEQLVNAKAVDHRSDLWSLAVVAYHCLTGAVPFDSETFAGLVITIDKGAFTPPSSIRGQVPTVVDAWFAKALSKEPTERFASAKEMADTFILAAGAHAARPMDMDSVPDGVDGAAWLGAQHVAVKQPTFAGAAISTHEAKRKSFGGLIAGIGVVALLAAIGIVLVVAKVGRKQAPAATGLASSSVVVNSTSAPSTSSGSPFLPDTTAAPPASSFAVPLTSSSVPVASTPPGPSKTGVAGVPPRTGTPPKGTKPKTEGKAPASPEEPDRGF